MKISKVEKIGFEVDAFGSQESCGEDFIFSHGLGDTSKFIELNRIIVGGDSSSWTKAMLNLRRRLQSYIYEIDELLKTK